LRDVWISQILTKIRRLSLWRKIKGGAKVGEAEKKIDTVVNIDIE